ncbi:MAG: ribonuclease HII [Desulfovibrio sp.]|nr:ribonuclease HII [Desulfovibrio sp.]
MAGIDEAGRGCLAGPVVAAAVILPARFDLPGLDDSKSLSVHLRETLAPRIKSCALAWGLGVVWPPRIDACNILQASLEAMAQAVRVLQISPALLLVDGNKTIPAAVLASTWQKGHTGPPPRQRAIVHGDASEPAISAASILAKTFRDALMCHLAKRWPGYGFEKHKGYGTREHFATLQLLGPCPQHRRTFRGVLPRQSALQQATLL